jgi:HAD superfamily hydrolase (TIGR01450 family)
VLADPYDAILFDLDGTLLHGTDVVSGAPGTIAVLRQMRKRLAFVTNNSTATPEQVVAKLARAGIEVFLEEIQTSAMTTADLLADRMLKTAFVIGEEGIRRELARVGIRIDDGDPRRVDVVVVGCDRGANWSRLRRAAVLVQRGAALVATNADASFPAPGGERWPGAGALLAVLTTTTGLAAEIVGKPYPPLLESALVRAGGGRPLVVGDRLDTDIAGADTLGWDSLLVFSGLARPEDLREPGQPRPTYMAPSVGSLIEPA